MVKEAVGINDVVWPKNMPVREIVRLANSRNLSILKNYREIIEEEKKLFKRNRPQDSDSTENDDLKESNEEGKKNERNDVSEV